MIAGLVTFIWVPSLGCFHVGKYTSVCSVWGWVPTADLWIANKPTEKLMVVHSLKLTWNLKMDPWKRRFLLETIISRFHVNFWGCSSQIPGLFFENSWLRTSEDELLCWGVQITETKRKVFIGSMKPFSGDWIPRECGDSSKHEDHLNILNPRSPSRLFSEWSWSAKTTYVY